VLQRTTNFGSGALVPEGYALTGEFGLDRLACVDWPPEKLPEGHVRIAIEAVSLNRRDLLLVEGVYAPRLRMPAIPCSDAAGRVTECGDGVTRFAVGDHVVAHMFPDWLAGTPSAEALRASLGGPVRQGTLRREIVLPERTVLRFPAFLSAAEAATLPCAALTAWAAVMKFGAARPGRSVLVQGTGGVSLFALQFARMVGATVVATSSHADKLEKLNALGADAVVNYRADPDWAERARQHVGGAFDLVIDVAGDLDTSIRSVRPGGMVASIGVLAGARSEITLPLVVMRQVTLQGVTCGSYEDFCDMLAAITAAKMRPVISHTVPFRRAHDAFKAMRDGAHFGKIVVEMD
jgi:NADPH:quinone reductase-like Zn-dependent oxidoreductase